MVQVCCLARGLTDFEPFPNLNLVRLPYEIQKQPCERVTGEGREKRLPFKWSSITSSFAKLKSFALHAHIHAEGLRPSARRVAVLACLSLSAAQRNAMHACVGGRVA